MWRAHVRGTSPAAARGAARRGARSAAAGSRVGEGKVAAITGASTGIGLATAEALAGMGYATVLLVRDAGRGEAARARVDAAAARAGFPARCDVVPVELGSLASVREGGVQVSRLVGAGGLDVLVNNAGVMACPEGRTEDGFETQFGVNHMGHFALTVALEGALLGAARPRIVTLSSHAHLFGRVDMEDLQYARGRRYSAWGAYGQSKLANILFTKELARRLGSRGEAVCCHPGIVATELQRHIAPKWLPAPQDGPAWAQRLAYALLKSPAQGADTPVWLATEGDAVKSGEYYADRMPFPGLSPQALDAEAQARLWDISSELAGTDPAAFLV